jgi:putative ABC transport system permease protein
MAVGAVFSALNSMYSAVSTRAVEIATLRAIGFGAAPVVTSVLTEALLLAAIGGAIGVLIAWILFDGHTVSTLAGGLGFTQMAFELIVTPGMLLTGMLWACAIGLIGALLPSIRAARLPVAMALRAL